MLQVESYVLWKKKDNLFTVRRTVNQIIETSDLLMFSVSLNDALRKILWVAWIAFFNTQNLF